MTDRKTIVVTWTDSSRPQTVLAALWLNEGTDADLNNALAYAAQEQRNRGEVHRVHTFATNDPQWKTKAIAAHAAGRGV